MKNQLKSERIAGIVLASVLLLSLLSANSSAQLGEVAGQLNFQVPLGHNQTVLWHLLNEGNTSISIQIGSSSSLQPSNAILAAKQPLPIVKIIPLNLTIPPHSLVNINVTVFMPKNETPGLVTWTGQLSAQEVTNATNPGGAVVIQGVGKIFAIGSILPPPPPTTSTIVQTPAPITTVSSSTNPILGAALLVIAVFAAYGYYRYLRKRGTGRPKPKGKKKPESDEAESLRREIARLKREQERLKRQVGTSKKSRKSGSRKRKGSARRSTRRTRRRRR